MSRPTAVATITAAGTTDGPRQWNLAGWTHALATPGPEPVRSRISAHLGGLLALGALLSYLTWRIGWTLPDDGGWRTAAWLLVGFEALPVFPLLVRMVTLWNIDGRAPTAVTEPPRGMRVAVLVPTYNEPVEVIAPTIAAACVLEPAHETWVLDDGDRPWVRDLCEEYGARYVRRDEHTHAKAGNMNHALALMEREAAAGAPSIDLIAVLDCDHVPLPHFLTATLGWFEDPDVALVQGPQAYYNAGAFDDDGFSGEQGIFFHVLLAARNHDGAGPFWCGSTSLLRVDALRGAGGIATETIVEDMHTTLGLIRAGWKTVYHHQSLAVGLAPETAEQYLVQRRRWAMGAMQVLTLERLWRAKTWMSWRNYYEYLSGTVWWLEGVFTLAMFAVPAAVLFSGAVTSTAPPVLFAAVFTLTFVVRLWGSKRLFRGHLHIPTAFALRVFRIPVGIACLWWLLTRRTLEFQVTPKAGADERIRGRVPRVLWVLFGLVLAMIAYAGAGLLGLVPWRGTVGGSIASGLWLLLGAVVLLLGTRRIRSAEFASSRRNAHRFGLDVHALVDGEPCVVLDLSVGGASVRLDGPPPADGSMASLELPGADEPVSLCLLRSRREGESSVLSLQVASGDWRSHRVLSLWLFHTPAGLVPGLPDGVPAVGIAAD